MLLWPCVIEIGVLKYEMEVNWEEGTPWHDWCILGPKRLLKGPWGLQMAWALEGSGGPVKGPGPGPQRAHAPAIINAPVGGTAAAH